MVRIRPIFVGLAVLVLISGFTLAEPAGASSPAEGQSNASNDHQFPLRIPIGGGPLLDKDHSDRSVHVNVPPLEGRHQVTAYSIDPSHSEGLHTQPSEQWLIEGYDADGRLIFSTKPTADMPDNVTEQVDALGVYDFSGVATLQAIHARQGTTYPNSVTPVAVEITPETGDELGQGLPHCFGEACDGLNPIDYSCRLGAELLTSISPIDTNWNAEVEIGIMYSSSCQTAWLSAKTFGNTPFFVSSSISGQSTPCETRCFGIDSLARYVEIGWAVEEPECVPTDTEFCESGGRADSYYVSPMVAIVGDRSVRACFNDQECTTAVSVDRVDLTLPCYSYALFQCGGRVPTERAECLSRFAFDQERIEIPNPIPERVPSGDAGEPEFGIEGDISLSELASYLAYFVDTEIPAVVQVADVPIPDPIDDVLQLPPLREVRPETVDRLITSPPLMSAQLKIMARLVCHVEDRLPPLSMAEFTDLISDETSGSDSGVDFVVGHNVLRAFARGSAASGISWDRISEADGCDSESLCYSLSGYRVTFNRSRLPAHIPENPYGVFYAMFSPSEFGVQDPGDWYHYFVAAIVGFYGSTGDILLDANFALPVVGDPMGVITGWVYSTMNQMKSGFINADYLDQAWWLLNSLSFLEATRDGRNQEEVSREMQVHRKGLIAGMSKGDPLGFSLRQSWCWYVADAGAFGRGEQVLRIVRPSIPFASWVFDTYSADGSRRDRRECASTGQ